MNTTIKHNIMGAACLIAFLFSGNSEAQTQTVCQYGNDGRVYCATAPSYDEQIRQQLQQSQANYWQWQQYYAQQEAIRQQQEAIREMQRQRVCANQVVADITCYIR